MAKQVGQQAGLAWLTNLINPGAGIVQLGKQMGAAFREGGGGLYGVLAAGNVLNPVNSLLEAGNITNEELGQSFYLEGIGEYAAAAQHTEVAGGAYANVVKAGVETGQTVGGLNTARGFTGRARGGGGGRKSEYGSYTNTHASGKTYSGMGGREQSQRSGRRIAEEHGDPHVSTDWTPAASKAHQRFDEALRIHEQGGAGSESNYNKIHTGRSVDLQLYNDFVRYILRKEPL